MYHSQSPLVAAAAVAPPATLAAPATRWPGWRLHAGLAAALALLAAILWDDGMAVAMTSADTLPYYGLGAAALAARLALGDSPRRALRAIGRCAEYCALFTLMGLIGAIASYPMSADSHGFVDGALQRVDEALGFDWIAWYLTVAAHPALQLAGRAAYASIYWTPAAMFAFFAWTDRDREARRMLAQFFVGVALTLALFHFMPAVGPFSYLWHDAIPYMPDSRLWQPELIPALRDGSFTLIRVGELRGLVSAPSFHTVAAVLYIVAAWPHARLRWPVLAVNVAMLLSTPVEGTHYLADMILGALVAIAAVAVVNWAGERQERRAAALAFARLAY